MKFQANLDFGQTAYSELLNEIGHFLALKKFKVIVKDLTQNKMQTKIYKYM